MPYHGRTFECDSSFSELHLSHHRYRVLSYYIDAWSQAFCSKQYVGLQRYKNINSKIKNKKREM